MSLYEAPSLFPVGAIRDVVLMKDDVEGNDDSTGSQPTTIEVTVLDMD